MNDDLKDFTEENYPELAAAAEADKDKALDLIAAMDNLYEEIWGDKPTTDR